jgi:hypothetical protein
MIGTLIFAMVRSVYRLDGKVHAPVAQVITVGHPGSGKSLIEDLYNRLFSRVILPDVDKTAAFIKKTTSTKDKNEATTFWPPANYSNGRLQLVPVNTAPAAH